MRVKHPLPTSCPPCPPGVQPETLQCTGQCPTKGAPLPGHCFCYFVFSSSSLSNICCDSASVSVVTPGIHDLLMCLLPQQGSEHGESWSELLSMKILWLCTRCAPGLCGLGQYKDQLTQGFGIPCACVPWDCKATGKTWSMFLEYNSQ